MEREANDPRPLRALLVEDNAPDAALVRHLLDEQGAPVEIERVASLAAGLERLADRRHDAALLDLSLPDATGLDALERLRAAHPDLPVVVVTGLDDDRVGVEAVKRGAQDYLVKGRWDGEHLARAIRHAVERQRILDALRASEERYELVARAASDGIWDWDLRSDRAYFSPRWSELLGWGPPGLRPVREWIARVHPDDALALESRLADCAEGRAQELHAEYRIRRRDGEWRWMVNHGLAVHDGAGRTTRIAGLQRDVTSRKREEERIRHDVYHDPLTSLPNRTLLHERLARCLARLRRDASRRFAALFVDLDGFKLVNDRFGHLAGDRLLVDVARRLRDALRPQDTLARVGGDEFVVLVEDVEDPDDALRVAERVLALLARPFTLHGRAATISASVGVAVARPDEEQAEAVLARADRALYRAKEAGRACYHVADDAEDEPGEPRAAAAAAPAAERVDVRVAPVVAVRGGELARLVVRARDAGVRAAPGSQLAHERARALLRTACALARELAPPGGVAPPVAVLLPRGALAREGLVDDARRALDESRLAPGTLHLVLAERDVAAADERALARAHALAAAGVRLRAVVGRDELLPLAGLARLPLTGLDLDPEVLAAAREDGAGRLRALVGLAAGLGLAAAARAADPELARLAVRHGVAELGGPAAGPELVPAEVATWLAERRLRRDVLVPEPRLARATGEAPRPSPAEAPARGRRARSGP